MCIACAMAGQATSWSSFGHSATSVATGASSMNASSPLGTRSYDNLGAEWLSGENHIDSLLSPYKWRQETGTNSTVLTYSLVGRGQSWYSTAYPDGNDNGIAAYNDGLQALNSFEMDQVRLALQKWSNVADITFVEVIDSETVAGDLRFAYTSDAPTAYAYYPGGDPWSGDIWLGNNGNNHNPQLHTYGFGSILLHEIGHALGLKHPHEGPADGQLGPVATYDNDALIYTVMSYRDYEGDNLDGIRLGNQPITPMINDIAAIQWLYGANWSYNSGNNTYDYSAYSQIFETIWDGGGTDTITWHGRSEAVEIDLTPGSYSRIGSAYSTEDGYTDARTLGIAYGAWIENATGGNGNDVLHGNSLDNVLNGGAGTDTMYGGLGHDTFYVDDSDDQVIENSNEGVDIVCSSAYSFTFGDSTFLETLILLDGAVEGYGNYYQNTLIGNESTNKLFGEEGSDTLYGAGGNDLLSGGDGTDDLYGGFGDDFYFVTDGSDTLHEYAGQGVDTVASTAYSFTLGANIENLLLLDGASEGIGNSSANTITGNSGNNTLNGGLGVDTLTGGSGADAYYLDNAGDVIVEEMDGGWDLVYVGAGPIGYTLGENVENLTLLSGAELGGQYRGNGLANWITGNEDGNLLYGEDGDDKLIGGGQSDYLFGGSGNDNLQGGDYGDELRGEDGDDRLEGGEGSDLMYGGSGNDSYHVTDEGDVVDEEANTDNADEVHSSLTAYQLAAGVERLILEHGAVAGWGNELYNIITGNGDGNALSGYDGNDSLHGYAGDDDLNGGSGDDELDGGAGADEMRGGSGNDTYYVSDDGDVVDESSNTDDSDRVISSLAAYQLTAGVENLTLDTGASAGSGNELDNIITGNEDGNALAGYNGSDLLIGLDGDDSLNGGNDDDFLYGGAGADILTGGEGIDTAGYWGATSGITLSLTDSSLNSGDAAGDVLVEIEHISGSWYEDILSGDSDGNGFSGDGGDDLILGWNGDDSLSGGEGDDRIVGGAGNDIIDGGYGIQDMAAYSGRRWDYAVSRTADGSLTISDQRVNGDGQDLVADTEVFLFADGTSLSVDQVLNHGSGILLGNGTIRENSGTGTVIGTCSVANPDALSQFKYRLLDDAGKRFTLSGLTSDTLVATNGTMLDFEQSAAHSVVIEATDQFGARLIQTLTITVTDIVSENTAGTAGSDLLMGGKGADTIKGGAGNDKIAGGQGKDILEGGKGKDIFVFDTKPDKANIDKIIDFIVKDDTFYLDDAIFAKLGKGSDQKPGKLSKTFFTIGSKAKDKNDYLVYDMKKGTLWYDADGSGKGKAVEIATLSKNLKTMSAADFLIT